MIHIILHFFQESNFNEEIRQNRVKKRIKHSIITNFCLDPRVKDNYLLSHWSRAPFTSTFLILNLVNISGGNRLKDELKYEIMKVNG